MNVLFDDWLISNKQIHLLDNVIFCLLFSFFIYHQNKLIGPFLLVGFFCLLDKRDSGPAFSDCRASFSALHQRAGKLQQDWRRSAVSSLQGLAEPLARLMNQGRFSSGLILHQASVSRCVCKNNQQEVKGQRRRSPSSPPLLPTIPDPSLMQEPVWFIFW